MPVEKSYLETKLKDDFVLNPEKDTVEVVDLAGDNDHFEVRVFSERFLGKTKIEQHKMVYQTLRECAGTTLHALAIKTGITK